MWDGDAGGAGGVGAGAALCPLLPYTAKPPGAALDGGRGASGAQQLLHTDAKVELAVAHDGQICCDTTVLPSPGDGWNVLARLLMCESVDRPYRSNEATALPT